MKGERRWLLNHLCTLLILQRYTITWQDCNHIPNLGRNYYNNKHTRSYNDKVMIATIILHVGPDCTTQEVRERCERQNLECVNGPRGPRCVRKRPEKSGNEKIGVGSCTLDSVTYSKSPFWSWYALASWKDKPVYCLIVN